MTADGDRTANIPPQKKHSLISPLMHRTEMEISALRLLSSCLQTHLSILSPLSDTHTSPLAVSLSSCVSVWTERRLFCTVFTSCLISVCLPSLAFSLPLEASRFSDLEPLGDLGGLCVSLNHLAKRAGMGQKRTNYSYMSTHAHLACVCMGKRSTAEAFNTQTIHLFTQIRSLSFSFCSLTKI